MSRIAHDPAGVDRFRASFVPRRLASRLWVADRDCGRTVRFPAVALFADVRGFTPANEFLEEREGPIGAESITRLLESWFRAITEHIAIAGGECVELNGDSVLALWYPDSGEPVPARAFVDGIVARISALPAELEAIAQKTGGDFGVRTGIRMGLAAGEVVALKVPLGGMRFRIVTGGSAVARAIAAQGRAPTSEFVVADYAAEVLATALRNQSADPVSPTVGDADLARFAPDITTELDDPELHPWSNSLVPGIVLFASLGAFELHRSADRDRLEAAISEIATTTAPLGGSLNKVCFDEKGATALVPFGLPPHAVYVDVDAVAEAARRLSERLTAKVGGISIGIAGGTLFSGLIGDGTRRAHCINGHAVNRAARLALHASGRVLCDEATQRRMRSEGRTCSIGSLALKGFAAPIAVFEVRTLDAAAGGPITATSAIVGRTEELSLARSHLWGGRQRVRTFLAEGPPGIGKSCVLATLGDAARRAGCRVLVANAEPTMVNSPLAVWRRILRQVWEARPGTDDATTARWMAEIATRADVTADMLPLLVELLGGESAETEAVRALDPDALAHHRRKLVIAAVQSGVDNRETLMILEDVHWMDLASWELLAALQRAAFDVAIAMSARSGVAIPTAAQRAVRDHEGTRVVMMSELDMQETAALVTSVLGATETEATVAETVHRASGGNPFFVGELARSLEAGGQLSRRRGKVVARTVPLRIDLDDTGGIRGIVSNRIAQLAPGPRRLIKCASVAGMEFERDLLAVLEESGNAFDSDLKCLFDAKMLCEAEPATESGAPRLRFHHAIGRDGAYESLPSAQRQRLNRLAALWWERHSSDRDGVRDARLSHHWSEANEPSRSAVYAARAGAQALAAGAYDDAVRLLTNAVNRDVADAAFPRARLSRARLRQLRGAARVGAGDLTGGNADAREALTMLGVPFPKGTRGWCKAFVRELVRYAACALRSREPLSDAARERRRLACDAAGTVSDAAYFRAEVAPLLLANLHAFAQARRLGDDEPVARALGLFGYLAGMARQHRVAERLFRRGLAAARRSGNAKRVTDCLGGRAMYHLSFGRWATAYAILEETISVCRRASDPANLEMALTLRGLGACFEGRFAESLEFFRETYELAHERGSPHHRAWGLYAAAQNLLPVGAYEEAAELLADAELALREVDDRHSRLIATALAAQCSLRRGEVGAAREKAETALAIADGIVPNNFGSLAGYSALAEVWIDLCAVRGEEGGRARAGDREAEGRALRHLARYARWFPIGWPRSELLRGYRAAWSGAPEVALRKLQRARRRAESLGMQYDQARAWLAIATLDPQQSHEPLSNARRLLADCGATESAAWPIFPQPQQAQVSLADWAGKQVAG